MSKNREKTVENVKKPGKNRQKCRKTWKKTSKSRKKGKNRKIYQNLSKLLKK